MAGIDYEDRGDTFRPIKDPSYNNLTAKVLAHKPLTENIKIVENPVSLEVWSFDAHCLGEFQREEDTMWALLHT
ncbi:MAG: hypothetical protein K2J24_05850 [Muribaculaceae bacterium]|nr:hypothetical protein [Muribaculaceae bacterium]